MPKPAPPVWMHQKAVPTPPRLLALALAAGGGYVCAMLYEWIVIGAGASGLFFAATRAGRGPVLLLDRQERAGRKILLSGGGKCNVTNTAVGPDNYLGENPLFVRQALAAFTPAELLDFLRRMSIPVEEREHGQIFCRRGAEGLRDALLAEARKNGAEVRLGREISSVKATAEGGARFAVEAGGERYLGVNLLAACGGPAWPRAGASFLGRKIAGSFGHNYIRPHPALTPLKMPPGWPLHGLQGIKVEARVSAPAGPAFTLPLLFTHGGLSGPACLQASSYWREGQELLVDFLPEGDFGALLDAEGRQTPLGLLRHLLPERLARALLSDPARASYAERRNAELARAARTALDDAVHRHRAAPLPPGFEQAESSTGGVDTREVKPGSMESRLVPGLYFAGEVLDVCGQLGGYNLHWAWASAWLAGRP